MQCYFALATHVRLTVETHPIAMNIKYFEDTDTLYIELKAAEVAESKDLDENTVLDFDQSGNILGITVEHASQSESRETHEYI
ncbi:MAG: hypothetical protein QOH70_240 [Blastocatellia bacterium]|jgi:uncharacterized protein YuzE|nr:hypothetical protein [Blastocatellia bacterium]